MLLEGSAIRPNFWRAPTDNDFGAQLQKKQRVWLNPQMKLVSLTDSVAGGCAVISAVYSLPDVKAVLKLDYVINGDGSVDIDESMQAAESVAVADMFRFGMRMQMPRKFGTVEYYGRGPGENYSDRQQASDIGTLSTNVWLRNTIPIFCRRKQARAPICADGLLLTIPDLVWK